MNFGQPFEELLIKVVEFIPRLVVALITFAAGMLSARPLARWVERVLRKRKLDEEHICLLVRLSRWTVIVLTILVALDQVQFDVRGFLTGLGIAGLTVGFALQDIARNFVAGLLLLIRQPFDIGDAVQVVGYSGTVLEVNVRDTVIRTWDGEVVILANTSVFSEPIVNYSQASRRRRTIYVGLGYGQDSARAMRVFLETLHGVPGVLADPAPSVVAEELGDSALVLAVRFWVNTEAHGLLDVHSDAVLALNAAAEREGIELPYPIQTVRLADRRTDDL